LRYPSDILGTFGYHEADILRTPLDIKPGQARVSDAPGLGVELNEELVERYRVGEPVVIA
jgi:muconate cycloisomerase